MIKFKSKNLVDRGYSQHIIGNGGEEELIIVTAWGQDKRTSLVIVGATVDGVCRVLHDGKGKRVILANAIAAIDRVLTKWCSQGIKPTVNEQDWLDKQRGKTLDALAELYETGELPKPKKKKGKGKKKKSDSFMSERLDS